MNWCVANRAHSWLLLHAAVVEKNGRAIILPAPPGSGKSTLCTVLVCRGWRLLPDELTLVRHGDGMLAPLPRPVSLKNASIDLIQAFAPDVVFAPLAYGTAKGTVGHLRAPKDSIDRANEYAAPWAIVFPLWEAGAATVLTLLPKARTFMRVAHNAFNYMLMGERGVQTLGNLSEICDGYEFVYSQLEEALHVFDALAGEGA